MNRSMHAGIVILCCNFVQVGFAQELPPFIQRLIAEYEAALPQRAPDRLSGNFGIQVQRPTIEIWRYEYQGETVFYLPTSARDCCDTFSRLYDADGILICYPDGGITGQGDGRCSDFLNSRGRGVLVYGGSQLEGQSDEDEDTDTEAR